VHQKFLILLIFLPGSCHPKLVIIGPMSAQSDDPDFYKKCRYIVNRCDPTRLHYLQHLIQKRISRQCGFEQLPRSIVEIILLNLDVTSLIRLSQTNHFWHQFLFGIESEEFWGKYIKTELGAPLKEFAYMLGPELNMARTEMIMKAYKEESILARNWRKVRCKSIVVDILTNNHSTANLPDLPKVVTCLVIDGGNIYAGCDDGTVRIHSALTGDQIHILKGHRGGVWALKVSGDLLITGSTDRSVGVWSISEQRRRLELLGHTSTVRCIDLLDGYLVSGSRDGTGRIWNWASGECLQILNGHSDSIRCIKIVYFGGEYIVITGSYDSTVKIWRAKDGRLLHTLVGHEGRVYALALVENFLYTSGQDGFVMKWILPKGQLLFKFDNRRGLVGLMSCHRGVIASGCTDGSLMLFSPSDDPSNAEDDRIFLEEEGSSVTALAMNKRFLASGSDNGIKLYDIQTRQFIGHPLERADTLWQLACTECILVAAFQLSGVTKLALYNFYNVSMPDEREFLEGLKMMIDDED
jgi:F-box and WD-40 domain protein CDC4